WGAPNQFFQGSCTVQAYRTTAGVQGSAVLWYPGSFAPFHLGHLNCLTLAQSVTCAYGLRRAARQELEKQGIKVAGAYAKPQLQKSLSYKNLDNQSAILSSGNVRLRLMELILQQEDGIMADPYAIMRNSGNNFVDLRSFRANLTAAVTRMEGSGRADWASSLEIIWVIGDDAFSHFKDKLLDRPAAPKDDALKQVGPFRMCVVHNRPGQWTALGSRVDQLPFPVLEVTAPPELSPDLSATAVRKQWQSGASVEELAKLLGSTAAASYMVSLR
ncbi:slc38a6, partial [Symbiodinium pilosum]